ncbi:DUF6612 family protein [Saccharibacillus brassicae]|uniref:Lipoprotein n=1 Tax=Saccharibacillus brassicae TaxID=2583377 RepID=A0A4Y6V4N8_SACBS|nr:DUF6612 family protein [Saccharibacillus brassicae]QDH23546.1 hypothetical protein FFV09_23375 [Saccharibacillus brassicae]
MRKWGTAALSVMMMAALAACSTNEEAANTAAPVAETTAPATTETPAAETAAPAETAAVPTAEELLNKAQAASKELKSYNMVADMDQTMTLNGEETASKTKLNTDMVVEPMSAYQEISTQTGDTTNEVKQYITKDAIYMGMNDEWTKLPEENREQIMAGLENTANLDSSFEQFKSVAQDMKVTEEGDDYVLTADLSGDKIKSMASEMMGANTDEQTAAALDQMDIEEMKLTYAVNKETSYPTKSIVDMTMSMTGAAGEGQEMDMQMHMIMNSTISKHNEIEAIEVPKEVIDGVK